MSDFVLHKLEDICRRLDDLEKHEHGPGYHEHLIDHEEHARLHEKKENRQGERRGGKERRVSTEKYEGEERRA